MSRERGQITVVTIGFFLFLGLLAVVVVNSSAAFLERRELDNLADGAAIAAADGLSEEIFYRQGADERVQIDPQQARRLAAAYVAASGQRARLVQVSADGDQVHVRVERTIALAISPPGWTSRTTIVAEATSQLRLAESAVVGTG